MTATLDRVNIIRYKTVCERMKLVLQMEKELAAEKKVLREEIIRLAGGDRLEFGIKVQLVKGARRVNYNKLITDWEIDEATLEEYKECGAEYWKVTSY